MISTPRVPTQRPSISPPVQRAIIVAGRGGHLLQCTRHARSYLERYFSNGSLPAARNLLPPVLARWVDGAPPRLPLIVTGAEGHLEVHLFADLDLGETPGESNSPRGYQEHFILLLEEILLPLPAAPATLLKLGLTAREAEVLFWVAHGKRNAEIAKLLGTADNTIKKQMQSVCDKLGVDSRLAAALRAMELLNLPATETV
ncbi:MAG: two component transcriptional regulator, LuxR family [Chthoniobacteraceae bacterium]|nr:two component transcriptional regulator, LuxR family [Chthoniobacteraceae bacterium]